MTLILISILVLVVGNALFYWRFVRGEELRHLAEERDAEKRHADEFREITKVLVDGALAWRGLDTQAEAKLHAEMLGKGDEEREETLEELEAQMQTLQDPLRVSFEGEVGERRALALKIHRMKAQRDDGLIEKQEELVGEHFNSLDETDVAHLRIS